MGCRSEMRRGAWLNAEVASVEFRKQQGANVFRKGRERDEIHVHIADANLPGQVADVESEVKGLGDDPACAERDYQLA